MPPVAYAPQESFPMRLPQHIRERRESLEMLREFSTQLRDRFDERIYLCGSALDPSNLSPRDWDIRVRLPNHKFSCEFGDVGTWQEEGESGIWTPIRYKWSDACCVLSRKASEMSGLNCDVQIYPSLYWREYKGQPRVRLA